MNDNEMSVKELINILNLFCPDSVVRLDTFSVTNDDEDDCCVETHLHLIVEKDNGSDTVIMSEII
jgi:hypothetical protein